MAVPTVLEKITGPMYWRDSVFSLTVAMVSACSDHEGPVYDNGCAGPTSSGAKCPERLRARTVPQRRPPESTVMYRGAMAHAQRCDARSRVPAQRVRFDRHLALVLR